jgi:hypothetical protein
MIQAVTGRKNMIRGLFMAAVILLPILMYFQWLVPLRKLNNNSRQMISDVTHRLEYVSKTTGKVREMEMNTAKPRNVLNSLLGNRPTGSELVWLPQMLKEHFSHFGLTVGIVRFNTTLPVDGLNGYKRTYYAVGIPLGTDGKNNLGLLLAMAELEAQHRYLKVLDFVIKTDEINPALFTAGFNIETLNRE